MRIIANWALAVAALAVGLALSGALRADGDEEAEIKANRAKLGPEDQRLVAAQEWCPIMDDSRLGAMGVPFKLMLKDKNQKEQPVFVCCKGCQKKALADPEKTLAKVEELKAKARAGKK